MSRLINQIGYSCTYNMYVCMCVLVGVCIFGNNLVVYVGVNNQVFLYKCWFYYCLLKYISKLFLYLLNIQYDGPGGLGVTRNMRFSRILIFFMFTRHCVVSVSRLLYSLLLLIRNSWNFQLFCYSVVNMLFRNEIFWIFFRFLHTLLVSLFLWH